jgi:quinol monooxygenase YgiN
MQSATGSIGTTGPVSVTSLSPTPSTASTPTTSTRDRLAILVTCTAVYSGGQEEGALLCARLRAYDASRFLGNASSEIHTSSWDTPESVRGALFMFKWHSATQQEAFSRSKESMLDFELSKDKYVPNSMTLNRWTVLENPLQIMSFGDNDDNFEEAPASSFPAPLGTTQNARTDRYGVVSLRLQSPSSTSMGPPRLKRAYGMTIFAMCHPSKYTNLSDKLNILEASAQIEDGCDLFEVYTRTGQEGCHFLVYGVYRSEANYQFHAKQDYSFFVCGAHDLIIGYPLLHTWKRMDPYTVF